MKKRDFMATQNENAKDIRKKKYRDDLKKKIDNKLVDNKVKKYTKKHKEKGNSLVYNLFFYSLIGFIGISILYIGNHFLDRYIKKSSNNQSNFSKNVDQNYVKPITVSESFDIKEDIFNTQSISDQKAPELKDLSNNELVELKNVLANYDISPSIRKQALDSQYSAHDLFRHKNNDLKILDEKEKDKIFKGFEVGKAIEINKYGVIINVIPYTDAWKKGLTKYDKVIGLNNQTINKNAKLNDVYNAIYNPQYQFINWKRSNPDYAFNTTSLKEEPLYGKIAEAKLKNDVLILNIKEITPYTSSLIYQFIKTYGSSANGMVINLQDLQDQTYLGISELAWLLNGQKEEKIAEVTDHNKKQTAMYSKPVSFSTDPNVLQLINRIPKVVMVNNRTSGSPEVLASSITNAVIIGTETKGNENKDNFYQTSHHVIQLTNAIIRNKKGDSIRISPTKNLFIDIN